MWHRQASIGLTLGLLAITSSAAAQDAERPPNVVVIVADDLGYVDLSFLGSPDMRTPRIDSLARDGVYFVPGAFRTETVNSPQPIQFFSFRTRKTRTVAKIHKKLIGGPAGLAVSPDGRWLLYAQVDQNAADIMLVENFQ